MRIMRLVLFMALTALLAGCGSSGGVAGSSVEPGPGADPVPTKATVTIGTQAASAATVIYGVEFILHLPAGVTVPADPATGDVQPGLLRFANSGAFAGAKYLPATATARASVKMVIADTGGFTVGDLATLTCSVSPGVTVSAAEFSLDEFIAIDADTAVMPGITPHFTVQTQ
ncbi:MAG TPA: hypothetical protein DDY22_20960 [Geobacter sp.]|nr:hypothetical protein [Geobacter sp.]